MSGSDSSGSRPPSARTPIFIVGCPRSGTSLVYHILLSSEAFPRYLSESKILACRGHYGSLGVEGNREQFTEAFLASKQFRESGLDPDRFRHVATECTDYVHFLRIFMDEMTRNCDKRRWVEKTPAHAWSVTTLQRHFPSAKFIHVVRDGRDVAVSMRREGWTPEFGGDRLRQLLWAGSLWESIIQHVRNRRASLGDRILTIKYEYVVKNIDSAVGQLSTFADVDLTGDQVRRSEVGTLRTPNTAFEDEMHGVTGRPVGRWRHRLSSEEKKALEWTLSHSLRALEYPVSAPVPETPDLKIRMFVAALPHLSRLSRWIRKRSPVAGLGYDPLELEEG